MAFKALGLNDRLVQGILATGYTAPTEIQARAIPFAVAGKDIIGCAQTGTGKTAAFTLPILNRLAEKTEKTHHIKALVLTPTRELAQQIEDSVKQYGRFLSLRSLTVVGGMNIQNQLKHLQRGVDILIATPGRLIDHLDRRSVNLSHVEVLVLDEADRMFDMGFIDDVRLIIKQIPHERQTLLFSATMSKQVRHLIKDIQKNPELVEVGERRSPATTVTQHFYSVNDDKKLSLLLHILKEKELDSVLVFSKTKVGAERISNNLHKNGIKSVSIHSDRTQAQRQRALAGFKQGQFKVMVATDVAARGIDVTGISHVINYDIPTYAEDYIHRIGRTGRAESKGDALTFVTRSEARHVKKIEQFIGKRLEIQKYPGFDYHKVEEKPVGAAVADDSSDSEPNFNRERNNSSRESYRRNERRGDRPTGYAGRTNRRDDNRGGDRFRRTNDGERKRNFPSTGDRTGSVRPSFSEGRSQRDFSKRESTGGERPFKKRETFGGDRRERSFEKRSTFGGPRSGFGKRERFGGSRNDRGFNKRETPGVQKREHTFAKQETFTEAGGYFPQRKQGGPNWKELIPEETTYKRREHKVVKKMVSRKKKDS